MSKPDAVAVRQPAPIKFGGIHLTADGVTFHGKPEFGDWSAALNAADYLEQRSPFWKARLFEYAYTRPDWEHLIDQVIDAERYTKRTVDQMRYVARNVRPEEEVPGLSFSHHEAVAALPSGDKRHLLTKAKRDHLSVAELKTEVRRVRSVKLLKGQASELEKASERVRAAAWDAALACREISHNECAKAEKKIAAARRALDHCEAAVKALRKAQGKK